MSESREAYLEQATAELSWTLQKLLSESGELPVPGNEYYDILVKYGSGWATAVRKSHKIDWPELWSSWVVFWSTLLVTEIKDANTHAEDFWNKRGGRDLYFTQHEDGTETQNEYLS